MAMSVGGWGEMFELRRRCLEVSPLWPAISPTPRAPIVGPATPRSCSWPSTTSRSWGPVERIA